ncbi:MAG: ParM/StbA family protein [Betaproteobacteria bacterium]|nr:ParM/StbA family protein [Betaproteobacteria bacterium]
MLAIDIGFSSCKCKARGREWKFPSFVAPTKARSVNLGDEPSGYLYKGQRFNVGDTNDGADGSKYVREIEFLLEYSPLFVAHAAKGLASFPSTLAVGLPLEQFRAFRDQIRTSLSEFEVNGRRYQFDVRVFPQAVGALAEYAGESNPPADEAGFLVDVGFNTAIVLKYQELKAKSDGSTQYNQFGISRALEGLGAIIKSKHSLTLSPLELNDVFLKGFLPRYGQRIDLSADLKGVISNHVDTLMKTLKDDFDRHLMRSDRLVMAGGGAYHINGQLPEQYKSFCRFLTSPEFANVRGYWRLAGGGN